MSSEQVLLDHIRTMEILDIHYDLLARESDVIALDLFKAAARELTDRQVMYLSPDPEKKGCLVIHYEKEKIEKIIVRSNGTITYVGKDIAYNFWKFGLLARDFSYRPFFSYPDCHPVYMTSSDPQPGGRRISAKAQRVYNVIDVRQSYLQNLIAQVLRPAGTRRAEPQFRPFRLRNGGPDPGLRPEMGLLAGARRGKQDRISRCRGARAAPSRPTN